MVLDTACVDRRAVRLSLPMRWIARIFFLILNIAVMSRLDMLGWRIDWLGYVLVVALMSFIAILVHELGHAAAVRHFGGQIHKIVVVPFQLRFNPRRFGWAKTHAREIGGYVSYTLDRVEKRRKEIVIAAAGPGANMAFALLLATLVLPVAGLLLAPDVMPPATHPAGLLPSESQIEAFIAIEKQRQVQRAVMLLIQALALLSAGVGIANLIPFDGSDGAAIRKLLARGRGRIGN